MMVAAILRGVWLGLCIAAPVGPIGVLVLKQALQAGRGAGLASGFGAALADMIYGLLASFGIRLAAGYARSVALIGGVILLWLAWRSWHSVSRIESGTEARAGTATTFLLTLSNPMTILSFAAMIASTGATSPYAFVAGVFLGSMLWWTMLSFAADRLRTVVQFRASLLNQIAAVSLGSFGVWAIATHLKP